MILPAAKKKPCTKFTDEITLVYGAPKIGKSTFLSGFENALFFDSESGLNNLEVYRVSVTDWETFKEAGSDLRNLVKSGKCPYTPLVFDTIDNLYMMCVDYICKKNNIKHPSDLDYGKGWNMVRTEFVSVLQAFRALDLGVIYVSHAKPVEIKTRLGNHTKMVTTMTGACQDVIIPSCDLILYARSITEKDGKEERVLETKPSQDWTAGDKTGKLPAQLPLNCKKVIEAFNKAMKGE